jgi:dolichol-phosphate hexosyltransferase
LKKSAYPSVKVIIASLNEEEGIGRTLDELKSILYDLDCLIVDGNSTDRTVEIAKNFGADVVLQKGLGKGSAICEALTYVTDDPKYVLFIDADFTYSAENVMSMVKILEENPSVGMVCGNRFNRHLTVTAMKNPLYVGNRLLALVSRMLNGLDLIDPLTGLRLVRWELLADWKPRSRGFDIEVEMNYHIENMGYKIVEVEIVYRPRLGEKKLKMKHGFTILKRIISENISLRQFTGE